MELKKLLLCICCILCIHLKAQKQFEHLTPTKENIILVCNYHNISHTNYVVAQAIQESGLKTKDHNNLFGLKHKNGLYIFRHWSYSILFYKNKIQSRYKVGEHYLSFLKRIKYASDPNYIKKIKQISKTV